METSNALSLVTGDNIEEFTLDGWASALTGMGILGKDKNESTTFVRRGRIHFDVLDAMYRQDPIASRIIDVIVDDALRQGFRIVFKGTDKDPIDPEMVNDINAKANKWAKSSGVSLHVNVKSHLKQARTFGGSVLVMGANDGQDPLFPLDMDKVQEVTFLKSLDRFQLSASGLLDTDPNSGGFGFPAWYHLNSVFGSFELVSSALLDKDISSRLGVVDRTRIPGAPNVGGTSSILSPAATSGVMTEGSLTLNNVTVHTSRLVRTDGTLLSDRSRLNNDGWGDSILERAFVPLRNWNTVMSATGTLVNDMNVGVYGIKGLSQILAANKEALIQKRFAMMALAASNWQSKVIDADGESFTRTSTQLAGLADVIDRFGVHLAAAAGMPLTLILELSPGGFGTGKHEDNQWDDVVKAYQLEVVQPVLEQVFKVLFGTPEFASVPDTWDIEFFPLDQSTEGEQAELHLKQAQADAIYITNAVLSPSEVAESRFGGEKYSVDTQLDEPAREGMKPAEGDDANALEGEAAEQNALAAGKGEKDAPPSEGEGDDTSTGAAESTPNGEDEGNQVPGAPASMPLEGTGTEVAGATLEGELIPGEIEVKPEEAADPSTAFNGAQVAALSGIVTAVVQGTMPFASAVQLAAISFPIDEAAATRLLLPAQAMAATVALEKEATKAAMDPAMKAQMDKPAPGQPGGPDAGNPPGADAPPDPQPGEEVPPEA